MSIASKMKAIADSKQIPLTFKEKHDILNKIEQEANNGKYELSLHDYMHKHREIKTYLEEVGFEIHALTIGDPDTTLCLVIRWDI